MKRPDYQPRPKRWMKLSRKSEEMPGAFDSAQDTLVQLVHQSLRNRRK